jgi:DUF1009 family protein
MSTFEKIGIIAGGGAVPAQVAASWHGGIFVVGFDGQSDPDFVEAHEHLWIKIGQTGLALKALRARGIKNLVLIGSLKRPNWSAIKPDLKTVEFLARDGVTMLGDDGLLRALRIFLQREGFVLHGAHKIAPDLLMPEGVLSRVVPSEAQMRDILLGYKAAQDLGRADIGQAVLVHHGLIIGREDARGTDVMMKAHGREGAILIKACKPQQDMDLDLPTMGLRTIELAFEVGLSGIVLEASRALMLDRQAVMAYADMRNMFVVGI